VLNRIPRFRIPVEKAAAFRNTRSVLQLRRLKSRALKLNVLAVQGVATPHPFLRPKMPELDSLRGIACLVVLIFHGFGNHYSADGLRTIPRVFVQATGYGWTGVNLFFVLSGFLITGILLDSREERGYYKRFYIRRALRILPVYFGVIALLIGLSMGGMINHPAGWSFIGLSLVYLANVTNLLGVPLQYRVLWSLAVEEHFYLLWPTCVRKLSLRGTAMAAGAICLFSLGCRIAASALGYDVYGYATWLVADGLGMGALLAIAARAFNQNRKVLWSIAGAAAIGSSGCFLIDRVFGRDSALAGGALHITGYNGFFASLVTATLLLGSRFSIRQPVLEFFGEISYGLYLVHMLCFDFYDHFAPKIWPHLANGTGHFGVMVVRFTVGGALAIAIATVSRRYYEEPFLRLKHRLAPSSPAGGGVRFELPDAAPAVSGVDLAGVETPATT